jgi:hypothetical protein
MVSNKMNSNNEKLASMPLPEIKTKWLVIIAIILGLSIVVVELQRQRVEQLSSHNWHSIKIGLGDIAAFNCSANGAHCAAVSSNGQVMVSRGNNWERITPLTLEDGELINALVIDEAGKIVVGTGVDQSRWTSLYQLNATQWTKQTGNYGGIAAAGSNEEIMVGGDGLFYDPVQQWQQIPNCENITLYAVAANHKEILATGEHGVVASQFNNQWTTSFLPNSSSTGQVSKVNLSANLAEHSKLTFYAAGLSANRETAIVAGADGYLGWRANQQWEVKKVVNGDILAVYVEADGKAAFIGGKKNNGAGFILRTVDKGQTWQNATLKTNQPLRSIIKFVLSDNELLAAANDGTLYQLE